LTYRVQGDNSATTSLDPPNLSDMIFIKLTLLHLIKRVDAAALKFMFET